METNPGPWPLNPGWPFVSVLLGTIALLLVLRFLLFRSVGRPRFERVTGGLEHGALAAVLLIMILLAAVQIVLRNVFHHGILWIDPLLRLCVLWLCFLGAAAATSKGRHLAIDAIPLLFPLQLRRLTRRVTSLLAATLCVLLAEGAYEYLNQERQFGGAEILGIASWQAQSILLLGMASLAYRFLVAAIEGADEDPHAPLAEATNPPIDDPTGNRPAASRSLTARAGDDDRAEELLRIDTASS